jgi:hypothetical protein
MLPTDATVADYFCKGIETALLPPELARAWVDSVIANTSEPPYAFIEIALSQGVPELISALKEVSGERDHSKVGRWLLGNLQQAELQSTAGLAAAIQKAMLVCRHCGLDDQTYYEFDGIDDSLYLARHGQYGTVDECRAEFFACLQRHALPFPGASQAQPIIPPDLSRQAALGR